jgi:hypothetical protein
MAGTSGESVTEGLDELRDRLAEYDGIGARFAKWRTVVRVTHMLPSDACVTANPHALGRYAALAQEQHLVPIVEPEVLMDGDHSIERCEEVTGTVLMKRDQSASRAPTLDNQLLLWTGTAGSGVERLAWAQRASAGGAAGTVPSGPLQQRASLGAYTEEMEVQRTRTNMPAHRREWHDD